MDGSLDEHLQTTSLSCLGGMVDYPHILFCQDSLSFEELAFSFLFQLSTRSTMAEDWPSNHQVIIIFYMRSSRHVPKNDSLSLLSLSLNGRPSSSLEYLPTLGKLCQFLNRRIFKLFKNVPHMKTLKSSWAIQSFKMSRTLEF